MFSARPYGENLPLLSSVPSAAPKNIAVEVINTTILRVSWTPPPRHTVRGHLGGYNVSLQHVFFPDFFKRLRFSSREHFQYMKQIRVRTIAAVSRIYSMDRLRYPIKRKCIAGMSKFE